MIIAIILIVLAGVVYLIINSSAQSNTTTPNTNISITTTPFVNPIPNFILIKGDLNLFYILNKMTDNVDSENRTISNLTWNKDMNIIINPDDNDTNRLAVQFRFFAEYWLNKLNINSGFTNVYDLTGNIGRYDFSRNVTEYNGKFNGATWSWDNVNYCFNTVDAKRDKKCLGGWIYNTNNGKCYPPLNSTSTCNNYDHQTMYKYTDIKDITNWMGSCNVINSPNCIDSKARLSGNPPASPVGNPPASPVGNTPASPVGNTPASPVGTPASITTTPASRTTTPASITTTPASITTTPASRTTTPTSRTTTPQPPTQTIFRRSGESGSHCCGGNGGHPHELTCPEGSFVNQFYGGAGYYIDRIGVRCSNGQDFGTRGGSGGDPFNVHSNSGFNKIHVRSGNAVDRLTFFDNNNSERGAVGGWGGDGPHNLNCGDGKIMGLKLRSGDLVDRIQVVCGREQ
jgi:hypothetical protein